MKGISQGIAKYALVASTGGSFVGAGMVLNKPDTIEIPNHKIVRRSKQDKENDMNVATALITTGLGLGYAASLTDGRIRPDKILSQAEKESGFKRS